MDDVTKTAPGGIKGEEHWIAKDGDAKLFLFQKCAGDPKRSAGTILFVHGSSMPGQPTFDLHVDGRPDSSVMDWFARRDFDCWCVDMEGYGRSTKDRDNNAPIAQGADDCLAAATYIQRLKGSRAKIEWINALSIGRRFLVKNSGSLFRRSASVGEPSPVQTMASSARRATSVGWRCANKAARRAPDEMP